MSGEQWYRNDDWDARGKRGEMGVPSSPVLSCDFQFQVNYPRFPSHRPCSAGRYTRSPSADTNFPSQGVAAVSHLAHGCADPYALNPDTDSAAHASSTLRVFVASLK